jgi:hypothetical protein
MHLKIDEEFKKLIPPLSDEEFKQLEENILAEGIRDKVLIWQNIIIDGHNRFSIAQKHNINFDVLQKEFETRDDVIVWIINNQLGRRNLPEYTKLELYGEKKKVLKRQGREKQSHGLTAPGKSLLSNNDKSDESEKHNTRKIIANELGVSTGKVAMFEVLDKKAPEEIKEKLRKEEMTISGAYKELQKEEKQKQRQEELEKKKQITEQLFVEKKAELNIDDIKPGWHKIGNQFLYFGSNMDDEFVSFIHPNSVMAFADPPYNAGVDEWDKNFKWEQDYIENYADVVAVTPGGWNAFNFYKETNMKYIWEMCGWIKNGMTHGKCGYANFIKVSIFSKNKKVKISQDHFELTIKTSESGDTKHKGRKPYDFMYHLINLFTKENDTIIDLFAGSGTTLLMSEQMNRISYNAELSKEFCIDIIKRGLSKGMQYECL